MWINACIEIGCGGLGVFVGVVLGRAALVEGDWVGAAVTVDVGDEACGAVADSLALQATNTRAAGSTRRAFTEPVFPAVWERPDGRYQVVTIGVLGESDHKFASPPRVVVRCRDEPQLSPDSLPGSVLACRLPAGTRRGSQAAGPGAGNRRSGLSITEFRGFSSS